MSQLPFDHLWPDSAEIRDHRLVIAGCDIGRLAAQHGTPLTVFDEATIVNAIAAYKNGLGAYSAERSIHYAAKALLNTAIAQLMLREGIGIDVVSLNELALVRHAGVDPARVHFHGNATPSAELAQAMAWGVGCLIIDNLSQLTSVIALSHRLQQPQAVMLRVAPDVVAGGHAHIQTGHKASKFGMPPDAIGSAIDQLNAAPGLQLIGLHAHIGSQIRDSEPLAAMVDCLLDIAHSEHDRVGWQIQELCVGGGLAVPTSATEQPVSIAAYCDRLVSKVAEACAQRRLTLPRLSIEPGRSLVARAGVAVYTVTGSKPRADAPDFLHVDGGMGDNIRPSLYNTSYEALRVDSADVPAVSNYAVAGRYCESADVLIKSVALPPTRPGDLLAVPAAGAYTLSMASNYNGIGRPAVLLLRNGVAHLIQRRETAIDLALPGQLHSICQIGFSPCRYCPSQPSIV
ncbi:MAG: diaminopimelate decarboxylase [Anaerolineae bacterium]|nr:diaminopimelate decarboxylase [Anaerolineae bacterium]